MLSASEKGFQRSIGRRGGCLGTEQVVRAWSVRSGQDWAWHRCRCTGSTYGRQAEMIAHGIVSRAGRLAGRLSRRGRTLAAGWPGARV
jgi:hypothetical protein